MFERHFGVFAAIAVLAIFLAGTQLSPGFSVNTLYLVVILMAIWAPAPQSAYWLAGTSTLLLGAATLTMPPPVSASAAAFSRTVIVVVMWFIAFVVVRYRRNEDRRQDDANARYQAEQARRRSDKNLEDIRYAIEQSAIVATTTTAGEITYVNDKFCEVSGYTRREILGQSYRFLNSRLHPADYFTQMHAAISAGHIWRGEVRNRAKDGSFFWVDTTIVPVLDERGTPHQYIAIQHDVTERKRSEAALRDQEALAKLGRMAAVVAHEVRNPLAGIRGAMQVIGRRLPPASQERAVVEEAVARIDTLNGIVEDLLLFARPSQPVLGPVAVSEILRETVTLFQQDPEIASVAVTIEPSSLVISADADQLKLVLLNLLINGAQAMRGQGELSITSRTVGKCHEIRIADQGPGIAADIREHLFEPFFTTRHHGTGLGLVTARRILEAHGGTVQLECPPDGSTGTIAIVRLPAR